MTEYCISNKTCLWLLIVNLIITVGSLLVKSDFLDVLNYAERLNMILLIL